MDDVRTRALRYLEAHNVATLATSGPDGPWAAAVFFANRGFTLLFLSSPRSRHCQDPGRMAATVQEDYRDWREIKGIQLEGEARMLEGGEEAEARALYARKFPLVASPVGTIAAALSRVRWYALEPRRVYFIDNSAGFGHRDEIVP